MLTAWDTMLPNTVKLEINVRKFDTADLKTALIMNID